MRIKTDQEIVNHIDPNDVVVGTIPYEMWLDVVRYRLRGWVVDNHEGYEWSEFLDKLNKKIELNKKK